jgi:hypothetical protein
MLTVLQALTGRALPDGSKTVVDAAVRRQEAHGKYLNHQKITRFVTATFPSSHKRRSLIGSYRPGTLVTSEESMIAKKKVWREIVKILLKHMLEISHITWWTLICTKFCLYICIELF